MEGRLSVGLKGRKKDSSGRSPEKRAQPGDTRNGECEPGKGERGLQYPFLSPVPGSLTCGPQPGVLLAAYGSSVHPRLSFYSRSAAEAIPRSAVRGAPHSGAGQSHGSKAWLITSTDWHGLYIEIFIRENPWKSVVKCSLMLIDTHAHLCDSAFDTDLGAVLDRARNAGVTGIVAVGETLADAERNLALAEWHPMIRAAAGLYPTHLDLEAAADMRDFIRSHRQELVAIGEVGLDYWMVKDGSGLEIQREIFGSFIELSKELNLPLNVHSRSAGRHAVDILLKSGAARVQLHAFDGKASAARPAVEAGYFFSVPPSVLRSEQKQKLVRMLPLYSLLVETDSPVLGPVPKERNEPANATIAVKAIAELKGITVGEVAEAVWENTRRLYGEVFS